MEFCAKTLADFGFTVEILAWDRIGYALPFETRDNYSIRRIHVKSKFNQKLRQLIPLIHFYRLAYQYLRNRDDCRIVHCNDFDTFPLGLLLKWTRRKKVVYDAHEIYCDMVFDNHPVLRKLCILFERALIRNADLFFSVGEVRNHWYASHGYKKIPIILGNWKHRFDTGLDPALERVKRGLTDKIVILYIGTFNPERNLEDLINAVNGDQRFHLILGGDGAQKSKILEMIEGAPNIEYLGFVKGQQMIDFYNSLCDVIYYGLYKDALISETAVPNKMFEAIAFNKLFLTSPFGEMLAVDPDGRTFVYIRQLKQQLNEIAEIIGNDGIRRKISANNETLYRKYSREKAAAILRGSYAGLVKSIGPEEHANVAKMTPNDAKVM